MDFNKTLISCSSLPGIMANTKDTKPLSPKQLLEIDTLQNKYKKTPKQQGRLDYLLERVKNTGKVDSISGNGIKSLKDIYVSEKWGKKPVNSAKDYVPSILHGILSEGNSLELINQLDNTKYKVHKGLTKNKYLKGILDAYLGTSIRKANKVIDIKTCASMQSLVALIRDEELKSSFYWQIMGYLAITGADEGEICHCVVSYPERMINEEINRFLHRAKNLGFDGDYIESQIEKIKYNLTFDEIPIEQRVVRFSVTRNEDEIKNIYEKVKFCRSWLNNFDNLHRSMNI